MQNRVASVMRFHPSDNVVVACKAIAAGYSLAAENVVVASDIVAGHKIAVRDMGVDAPVIRYGQVIGFARAPIKAGEHVHVHNCAFRNFQRDHAFSTDASPTQYFNEQAFFSGIVRSDGRIATRNYIGILTSVNCSAGTARYIAEAFRQNPFSGHNPLADYPNIDGVVALTHKTGCGMASEGMPMDVLRRTIAGYARHANFGAIVLVGLGCEANQVASLLRAEGLEEGDKFKTLVIQETSGARKTIEKGIEQIKNLLPLVNQIKRERVSASHLNVALQCGGSDSFSGMTANPALGYASDLVVRNGGTVVLSETTEIYGAEHLLTRRAVNAQVAQKLLDKLTWWENYTAKNGGSIDNNPSPGNKAGGLTNIVEKSLGAVVKAGTTNLVDVVDYAETVTAKGLVVMDGPGFDPVSATGQIAGGCNVLCFTTGRGSVFGCKPTPSIKLATNNFLYRRMPEDMDINCGDIAEGVETVEECGKRIFQTILQVASGQRTKSEAQGFGDDEFAPWQLGATV